MTPEQRTDKERAYQRAYRKANSEKLRAQAAAWRAANREKMRLYDKAYRAQHKVAHRERNAKRAVARRRTNPDKVSAATKRWAAANRDRRLASVKAYQARYPDRVRAQYRRWSLANPGVVAAKRLRRMLAERQAIPKWADHDAIKQIYLEAARLTQETGIQHTVDHIYPLRGRTVCGLHVSGNLRVITKSDNCRKSNTFPAEFSS